MPDSTRVAAASALPDRIAFLGFGLIGGSIALALREAGSRAHLSAWTPAGAGPARGLRGELIDVAAPNAAAAIDGAGLVILAGPPLAILDSLRDLAGVLRPDLAPDATITDVASTKAMIVATAEDLDLPFVGGHPMAGRELNGVEAADAALFVDRPWVIAADAGAAGPHIDRVEALALAVGARPVRMTPIDHDVAVAAISHVPLVAAAALVESAAADPAAWDVARPLAAGGWRVDDAPGPWRHRHGRRHHRHQRATDREPAARLPGRDRFLACRPRSDRRRRQARRDRRGIR